MSYHTAIVSKHDVYVCEKMEVYGMKKGICPDEQEVINALKHEVFAVNVYNTKGTSSSGWYWIKRDDLQAIYNTALASPIDGTLWNTNGQGTKQVVIKYNVQMKTGKIPLVL